MFAFRQTPEPPKKLNTICFNFICNGISGGQARNQLGTPGTNYKINYTEALEHRRAKSIQKH